MTPTRPLLRYYGGKWRLAPWIIDHLPPHRVYVEPFAGAASVLIRKPRSKVEAISDLDHRVVRLFRCLRDPSTREPLLEAVTLTPYALEEWEATWGEETGDLVEDCRRYLLRSWASYGCSATTSQRATGFRRASTGRAGGSHPAMDWARWPEAARAVAQRLRGVVIEHMPALEMIQRYDQPGAVIYADPPYVAATRSRPDHGYRHEMTEDEHLALLQALAACRAHVVLSGYPCSLYDDYLVGQRGWAFSDCRARIDGGGSATERLWLSPGIAAAVAGQTTIEGVA